MTPLTLTVVSIVIVIVSVLAGIPWLALIFFVVGVLALVWTLISFARGTAMKPVFHRTRDVELLGPGGPDDPDRTH